MKKLIAFLCLIASITNLIFGQPCSGGSLYEPPGCVLECHEWTDDSRGFTIGTQSYASDCPNLNIRKWYQVRSISDELTITSLQSNCVGTSGFSVEIFNTDLNSLSGCKTFNDNNVGQSITSFDVQPDQMYYISIAKDGPFHCDFRIGIAGIYTLPALAPTTPDIQVEPWSDFISGELFIPVVQNATSYNWYTSNSTSLTSITSGNGTNRVIYTKNRNASQIDEICVTPNNNCGSGQTKCITLPFTGCPLGSDQPPGCEIECPSFVLYNSDLDSNNYRGVLPNCGISGLKYTFWGSLTARKDTIKITQLKSATGEAYIQLFDENLIPVSACDTFGTSMGDIHSISVIPGDKYTFCAATASPNFSGAGLEIEFEGHEGSPFALPKINFDQMAVYDSGAVYLDTFGAAGIIEWEETSNLIITSGQGTPYAKYINNGDFRICVTVTSGACGTLKKQCAVLPNLPIGNCLPTSGGVPAGNVAPGCSLCGPIYQGSTEGYTPSAPGSAGFPCGTIENNQFISITADLSGTISVTALASNCLNNQGIQFIIYDQAFNPVSNCFSSDGNNTPGNVTASGLTPGEIYWIMIDGFAGDICDILVTTSGGANTGPPDPPGPLTMNPDTSPICPGAIATYSLAPVRGAEAYEWIIPVNSNIVSGGGLMDTFVEIEFFAAGGGVVRVTPENDCFPGIPAIEPVVVLPILPTLKPPEFICPNDFPIIRDGNIFSDAGTHEVIYQTSLGCDSTVTYVFIPDTNIPELIDTVICKGASIVVGDSTYNETTSETIILGPDFPPTIGCDSVIILRLKVLDPIAEVAPPGALGCSPGRLVTLDGTASSSGSDISYFWQVASQGVIEGRTDLPTADVSEPGIFVLTVTQADSSGVFCIARDTVEVIYTPNIQDPVFDPTPTGPICGGKNYTFSVAPVAGAYPDGYVWEIQQGNATIIGSSFFNSVDVNIPNQDGSTYICVTASGDCGTSDQTCFGTDYLETSTSDFSVSTQLCVGEPAQVTYTGNAGNNADFNWDFSGGTALSGADTGNPVIEFTTPGAYEISLIVTENGCTSSQTITAVAVNDRLANPLVSCNSTLTSVTFDWIPVFGASDYQVNVISGQTGQLSGTEFFVSGLSPNEEVTIEVIAVSSTGCSNAMSTATCIAQDCAFLPLAITPVPNICFAQNPQPIQLTSTGGNTTGTYRWFGNGVSADGIFDPQDAGIGMHQVEVVYMESGCDYSAQITITVEDFTDSPIITCVPALTNILFEWNSNPNIQSYDVVINGIAMGNQPGTSYLVDNLQPGEEVLISVIGKTANACGDVTSQLQCKANDCAPQTIEIIDLPESICYGENPNITVNSIHPPGVNFDFCTWSGPGINSNGKLEVDSLSPGIYTITLTCQAGNCTYNNTADFEILAKPELNGSVLSPIWYPGLTGSVDLSVQNGTAPYLFDWSNGSTSEDLIDVTRGQLYCVTVTDYEGCTETECYSVGEGIFRINQLNVICAGTPKTIAVRPGRGATFDWSPSTGLSCDDCANPTVNPSTSTIYNVTATLPDGRTASTNVLVIVVPTLFCNSLNSDDDARALFPNLDFDEEAIELDKLIDIREQTNEMVQSHSVKVSPNPTTGLINISSVFDIENVEVFDFSGRKIMNKKAAEIDLSDLSKGVYFLKIKVNGYTEEKRVVLI